MAEQRCRITIRKGWFFNTSLLLALCILALSTYASPSKHVSFSISGESTISTDNKELKSTKGHLGLQSREEVNGILVPASYLIYDEDQQYRGSYLAKESLSLELDEGKYIIHAIYSHSNQTAEVEVKAGRYSERQFIFSKTSELVFTALQDNDPVTAHFSVFAEDGKLLSSKLSKQSFKQRLPLGKYRLVVSYKEQEQTLDLQVNGKPSEQYWLIF